MSNEIKNEWEEINEKGVMHFDRIKVDGGYIYRTGTTETVAMVFVPDVDLTRYQSHLRDAFTQGYAAGKEDAKNGVSQDFTV